MSKTKIPSRVVDQIRLGVLTFYLTPIQIDWLTKQHIPPPYSSESEIKKRDMDCNNFIQHFIDKAIREHEESNK